jgi:hypothetical protein
MALPALTLVLVGPHDAAAALRVALAQRHGWRSDEALVMSGGDAALRALTPDALDARIMHAECDRDAAALAAGGAHAHAAAPRHRVVSSWHVGNLGAAQLRATDADAWGALHACAASAVLDYAARPNTLLLVQPLFAAGAAPCALVPRASTHGAMAAPPDAAHGGDAALALAHAAELGLSVLPAVACTDGLSVDAVADCVLANLMRAAMMAATSASSATDAAQLAQSLLGAAYVQKMLRRAAAAATSAHNNVPVSHAAGADAYGGLAGAGSCGAAEAARMGGASAPCAIRA